MFIRVKKSATCFGYINSDHIISIVVDENLIFSAEVTLATGQTFNLEKEEYLDFITKLRAIRNKQ